MNEIQIFEHEQFGQIRTLTDEIGQPWFVGKDIAEKLGYAIPQKAIRDLVSKEDTKELIYKAFSKTEKASLWQGNDFSNKMLINESGLYSLILASKLPQAREFKHWVTSVVLPQIRRTGGYLPVSEEDDEKTILCKAIAIYRRTIEQKDELLAEQKPKVIFANAITSADDSILIRDLAKILTQNGVKIGQARLFYWLVETHHGTKERCTTKVTGKGQQYFVQGFLSGRFKADNASFC